MFPPDPKEARAADMPMDVMPFDGGGMSPGAQPMVSQESYAAEGNMLKTLEFTAVPKSAPNGLW
jgi:hypothetical protein